VRGRALVRRDGRFLEVIERGLADKVHYEIANSLGVCGCLRRKQAPAHAPPQPVPKMLGNDLGWLKAFHGTSRSAVANRLSICRHAQHSDDTASAVHQLDPAGLGSPRENRGTVFAKLSSRDWIAHRLRVC